jgi:hypothetical protein
VGHFSRAALGQFSRALKARKHRMFADQPKPEYIVLLRRRSSKQACRAHRTRATVFPWDMSARRERPTGLAGHRGHPSGSRRPLHSLHRGLVQVVQHRQEAGTGVMMKDDQTTSIRGPQRQSPPAKEFDLLLSFAGPERAYARAIHDICRANGLNVFLDEEFQHEIWGQNLVEYLDRTYRDRGWYCLAIISKTYCERPFTRIERRAAFDRMINEAKEYLLPIKFDDAWPVGLPQATAYLDLRIQGILGVCEQLARKVGRPVPLVIPPDVFIPRIPAGNIPAQQLAQYFLELCQKQPIVLFGTLIYNESTVEFRKLLTDSHYWDALSEASGHDFEIFAVRDEEKYQSDMVMDRMTAATMGRSRNRGYYYSRLLKEYFGEDKTQLAYPSLLLFLVSGKKIVRTRLIPFRRDSIENIFRRLQDLATRIATVLTNWRSTDGKSIEALWEALKRDLLEAEYTLFIQNAPADLKQGIDGLMNFVPTSG